MRRSRTPARRSSEPRQAGPLWGLDGQRCGYMICADRDAQSVSTGRFGTPPLTRSRHDPVLAAIVSASVVFAFAAASGLPALASQVEGFGSIQTNLSDPALVQIDKAYQDPLSLVVRDTLQLTPVELGATGSKVLQYSGEAQFGRLGVATHIGGVSGALTLSSSVNAFVSSKDLISPTNLNPVGASFLRLDVGLSGNMQRSDSDFGNSTFAHFALHLIDPLNPDNFNQVSTLSFSWSDTGRSRTNTGRSRRFHRLRGSGTSLHVLAQRRPGADAGLRLFLRRQRSHRRSARWQRARILRLAIPDAGGTVPARVRRRCFVDLRRRDPCMQAHTDFSSTALIGNARIVDQNGNIVPGASFTSESGYDYITPPGSLVVSTPIPEPEPGHFARRSGRARRARAPAREPIPGRCDNRRRRVIMPP